MNKLKKTILLLLAVVISQSYAQVPQDAWVLGGGVSYPKLVNTTLSPSMINYGLYVSGQRDFTESTSLRALIRFFHLEGTNTLAGSTGDAKSTGVNSNIDLLYKLDPSAVVYPYFGMGVGVAAWMLDNPASPTTSNIGIGDIILDFQLNFLFGGTFEYDEDFKLNAEFGLHVLPIYSLDGDRTKNAGSTLIGGNYDSYATFEFGVLYYLDKGEASTRYNTSYAGGLTQKPDQLQTVRAEIDYDRIEDIVKKYIPSEVIKEVVVEKPVDRGGMPVDRSGTAMRYDNWVLVGVNYEFNSNRLSPEAYPILYHTVQVLIQNPEMKIEIHGHSDNIGSEVFNQKLSEQRAQAVKYYLMSKGISENRLRVVGLGEKMPIADNKTAFGRQINRRIEFKVIK